MSEQGGPGRRQFLTAAGLLAGGAAAGVAGGVGLEHRSKDSGSSAGTPGQTSDGFTTGEPITFEGARQSGIIDRAPASMRFLAFDLTKPASTAAGKDQLQSALKSLSDVARATMTGAWPLSTNNVASGLKPAGLTVTIGIGPGALTKAGLTVPGPLSPIPAFRTDHLVAARTGGDLGVQICSEDPMAVAATVRALVHSLAGIATVRWSQGGFLRSTSGAEAPSATPRNLMGQLDGTDNPTGSRQSLAVWVPSGVTPSWMVNGTYLVCRRIRMLLDDWEKLAVSSQEAVIGRWKNNGAPLSGAQEHDVPDFTSVSSAGTPEIAANAHIRLTNPSNNAGATMLRRGYSFDDGIDASGEPDAGLFFQAFQTDPRQVFVPIQQKLSLSDALSEFIRHEGSAVFAIPPGASAGGFVGEGLF